MHQTTVDLNTEPILANTLQANCVHCGAETEIVEKLFVDQIHWQVDQNCTACGECLRNLAWRKFEPEKDGLKDLERMTLTFRVLCEPEDAERLGWLNNLDTELNKAIAQILALTGRFHVALTTISWNPEVEAEDEPAEENWYGDSWCD